MKGFQLDSKIYPKMTNDKISEDKFNSEEEVVERNQTKKNHNIDLSEFALFEPKRPKQTLLEKLDEKFNFLSKIENPIVDTDDLPLSWRWCTFLLFIAGFTTCAVVLLTSEYYRNRTQSFITIEPNSGVCKDDSTLDTCCEIPLTVSGNYYVDTNNEWNTQNKFDLAKQIYSVSLEGIQYTNQKWQSIISILDSKIKHLGLIQGSERDFAWNLIAWVSYTSIFKGFGSLQFSLSGDVGVAFDKFVRLRGFASGSSDYNICHVNIETSFDSGSRTLQVATQINTTNNCQKSEFLGYVCHSPCPGIISLRGMGFDPTFAQNTIMKWKLDMATISVAMAVNLGILSVNDLTKIENDDSLQFMLDWMYSKGQINEFIYKNTVSYFDNSYSYMKPVYCTLFDKENDVAGCLVMIGNMLFYPVMNHFGWYNSVIPYPTRCQKADMIHFSAQYYCNIFDMLLGLIYYPLPDSIEGITFTMEDILQFISLKPNISTVEKMITNGIVMDNGKIFKFLNMSVQERLALKQDGDLYIPKKSYNAMLSTLTFPKFWENSTYSNNFDELCTNGTEVEGCAMFGIEFYDKYDLTISKYSYQLRKPAYNNTIYNASIFANIGANPPTRLIQNYYSCVLGVWDSLFAATGLASSNTQLYIGLGLLAYMLLLVVSQKFLLNNQNIQWKPIKSKKEDIKRQNMDEFVLALMQDLDTHTMKIDGGEKIYEALESAKKRIIAMDASEVNLRLLKPNHKKIRSTNEV